MRDEVQDQFQSQFPCPPGDSGIVCTAKVVLGEKRWGSGGEQKSTALYIFKWKKSWPFITSKVGMAQIGLCENAEMILL